MLRLAYVPAIVLTTAPLFLAATWLIEKLKLPGRRSLCVRYSRMLCRLLKVRIHVVGSAVQGRPALILCNHVSWLDILVIHAICPVAFVAKREVAGWPLVGLAARQQRAVFVDRARRQLTAEANAQIAQRLRDGDAVVLFAEGTSSDGNRVLEFRSALVGAVMQVDPAQDVVLQPASIGYTRIQGVPMGRQHRPLVAWYGDLDFTPHLRAFIQRGVVDVTVSFGTPVPFATGSDRKAVARSMESTVRRLTAAALRERAERKSAA
jgi:1-acyl-sn-glycerol-3-phosphate acyltransferase